MSAMSAIAGRSITTIISKLNRHSTVFHCLRNSKLNHSSMLFPYLLSSSSNNSRLLITHLYRCTTPRHQPIIPCLSPWGTTWDGHRNTNRRAPTNKLEKYNIAFHGEFLRGARQVHGHDGYTDLRIV